MSHFTRMRTSLRDPLVLAAALRETGYPEVEVHDSPQILHRQPDGSFEAVVDATDLARNGTQWLPGLTRAYGHAAALKYAQDHGYDVVTDEPEADGTRRLTLRRYT